VNRPAAPALALTLIWASGAAAQNARVDDVSSEAGAQLLSIVGLAATPDITASRLNLDDTGDLAGERIDVLRLANDLSVDFDDGTLFFEGNLGFARADVDLRLGDNVREKVNFDAIGAFGSVGPSLRVGEFTRLRPLAIIGMGYVSDDFGLPDDLAPDEGADIDLRQWSLAGGFGLSIDHERPIGDDTLDLRLKVSQLFFTTLWSGDPRFTGDTVNRNVNANAVYKYDTGIRLVGHPLLLTGLLGANAFLGDQRDALGFAWFAEYGGGLELDLSGGDTAVQRARVRVTGIAGDGVTGISFGLGVGF